MSYTSFELARERQCELLVAAEQRRARRRATTARRYDRKAQRLVRRAERASARARLAHAGA